jgi:hypothetical protein
MTGKKRIPALFRNSNGRLISATELVMGEYYGSKKIIEYTGRIKDARDEIGCTCGENKNGCQAQEHIVNVKTNWYQYKSSLPKREVVGLQRESVMLSTEQQLAKLRDQYRKARAKNDELRMDLIKRMAHRIKNPPERYFFEEVKRSLF